MMDENYIDKLISDAARLMKGLGIDLCSALVICNMEHEKAMFSCCLMASL